MPHSLPTEIPVSSASPVAITVLMFALCSLLITGIVSILSLFYKMTNPRNSKSYSVFSNSNDLN